jgi:hypothetical protein
MKSSLMCVTVIVLATALAGAGEGPSLELEQTVWDFGTITQGQPLDLEIRVSNPGDEDLLLEVKPTCGCTVVDSERIIPPGSSGTIQAEISTATMRGSVSRRILVVSNDPEHPAVSLTATAEVIPAG